MVTCFYVGTNRPTERLNLLVSSVSPLLKSYRDAFNDPNWQHAMCDEYNALIKNQTWMLVPRHPDINIVRCMWLFRHKYLADGSLSRYKAHLVINGNTQLQGVDVDETFSPVIKPGMFLSQRKYAGEILERTGMVTCNPSRTPVDIESKLGDNVQQVCLYMHDPREPYFYALKRILQYVHGTLDYGLQLFSSFTTDFIAFSDADWVGCPTTRRSTSGYYVFLSNNLLPWSSKRQPTLSRSSAEAEYRGVANAVAETCWLCHLLRELYTPLSFATFVYCDNVSAVYLSCNPVQHQRTKHIEIDIHFLRDSVTARQVCVLHVPCCYEYADIFTKGLSYVLFEEFCSSLSVRCSLAQTVERRFRFSLSSTSFSLLVLRVVRRVGIHISAGMTASVSYAKLNGVSPFLVLWFQSTFGSSFTHLDPSWCNLVLIPYILLRFVCSTTPFAWGGIRTWR
ncbi:ribonuclease H-like domain-containing protein [Tanacetum coccineum]|uniref:Ribonuclease H-like domain-containing protein n=1 Tax=Tanacetum coccineum TaxID=301880 RepID=A0ABQ4YN00_9ASTR